MQETATEPVRTTEGEEAPDNELLHLEPRGAPRRLRSLTPQGVVVELTRLKLPGRIAEAEYDSGRRLKDVWTHSQIRRIGQLLKEGGRRLVESGELAQDYYDLLERRLGSGAGKVFDASGHGREAITLGNDIIGTFEKSPTVPIDGLLGQYFPDERRVEIYGRACDDVAASLGLDPARLRRVVKVHEYAHAVTHLGLDADGQSWETEKFKKAETGLLESLAQYYAFVAAYLDEPSHVDEFSRLLEKQGPEYNAFKDYCNEGLEQVRYGLLCAREEDQATLAGFRRYLAEAPDRPYETNGLGQGNGAQTEG